MFFPSESIVSSGYAYLDFEHTLTTISQPYLQLTELANHPHNEKLWKLNVSALQDHNGLTGLLTGRPIIGKRNWGKSTWYNKSDWIVFSPRSTEELVNCFSSIVGKNYSGNEKAHETFFFQFLLTSKCRIVLLLEMSQNSTRSFQQYVLGNTSHQKPSAAASTHFVNGVTSRASRISQQVFSTKTYHIFWCLTVKILLKLVHFFQLSYTIHYKNKSIPFISLNLDWNSSQNLSIHDRNSTKFCILVFIAEKLSSLIH